MAAETFRLSRSEEVSETVTAGYLQSEARVFRGRTRILPGVRFERPAVKGRGPLSIPTAVFQPDASGNFFRDSRGALVGPAAPALVAVSWPAWRFGLPNWWFR